MAIITYILNRMGSKRLSRIELSRKYPAETQMETFRRLVARAAGTEWGKLHGYSSVTSVSEYQNRFPVQTYEDIIPYVERLGKGETNLLWPGKIKWFAKSSGTTSTKSKFIPVSGESLNECHYRAAKDIMIIYSALNPDTRIFSGKNLTLGGSCKIDRFGAGALYGDLSAILIENAPAWTGIIRTPDKATALIEDFEEKLDRIVRLTLNENITGMAGVPSWYLVLVKQILAHTCKTDLMDVWPNFEVFFHGGISFTPYREQFHSLIKSDRVKYMETYNASEGFFGIQDNLDVNDMLLMLDYGIFYEFIPTDSLLPGQQNAYALWEVEKDVNYAIVISTSGGLWRYMMGDTVTFTSLHPYRFRISGRTKHFINVFGEEVIVDNADKALDDACKATGAAVTDYTAGPVFMSTESKGAHEWIIEFEKEPTDINIFTYCLDEALKSLNSDYEAKRSKDLNLTMPVVNKVQKGTFGKWLVSKNRFGGQNKVPRLSNTREYIEEIKAFTQL